MSVAATVAQIQAMAATVPGIVSAPVERFASLNGVSLPLVYTTPGPAEWNPHAIGLRRQDRTYILEVYAGAVAQGRGIDQMYQLALLLLDGFGELFLSREGQSLWGTVDHIGVDGGRWKDTGLQTLTVGEVDYWGFQIELPVTQKTTE